MNYFIHARCEHSIIGQLTKKKTRNIKDCCGVSINPILCPFQIQAGSFHNATNLHFSVKNVVKTRVMGYKANKLVFP